MEKSVIFTFMRVLGGVIVQAFLMLMLLSACKYEKIQPVAPAMPSFSKHVQPIFNNNCALSGCHVTSSHQSGLDLREGVAYNNLFVLGEIDTTTNPIDVNNSNLYGRITATSGSIMPPKGALHPAYVETIKRWIEQGAKNN